MIAIRFISSPSIALLLFNIVLRVECFPIITSNSFQPRLIHKHRSSPLLSSSSSSSSSSSRSSRRTRQNRGDGNSGIAQSTGPKAESPRRRRRSSSGSDRSSTGRQRRRSTNNNTPEEGAEEEIFNPKKLTSLQSSNENSDPIDLNSYSSIHMRSANVIPSDLNMNKNEEGTNKTKDENNDGPIVGHPILHPHFEHLSLDDLFPNLDFSNHFSEDGKFREDIRQAMRKDIFYSTPAYSDLSPKVAAYMLDDDSSLQGSWNCIPSNKKESQSNSNENNNENTSSNIRMTRLTSVLQEYLGSSAPTGDTFMMEIGSLCGKDPSTHWIDIIGVKDRTVSHSWHQDTGRSYENDDSVGILNNSRYTVMLGFPQEDKYVGTGVFSHAIKLTNESLAPHGHRKNEPVLFEGTANDEYIVRPSFSLGKEILRYRDIDTLHSAPDVVYRKSVMRFM